MNSKLLEKKKRMADIEEKFKQIKTDIKKLFDEKEKIPAQLKEIKEKLDEEILSWEQYQDLLTKERFLINREQNIDERIYDLQQRRSDLVVERDTLNFLSRII